MWSDYGEKYIHDTKTRRKNTTKTGFAIIANKMACRRQHHVFILGVVIVILYVCYFLLKDTDTDSERLEILKHKEDNRYIYTSLKNEGSLREVESSRFERLRDRDDNRDLKERGFWNIKNIKNMRNKNNTKLNNRRIKGNVRLKRRQNGGITSLRNGNNIRKRFGKRPERNSRRKFRRDSVNGPKDKHAKGITRIVFTETGSSPRIKTKGHRINTRMEDTGTMNNASLEYRGHTRLNNRGTVKNTDVRNNGTNKTDRRRIVSNSRLNVRDERINSLKHTYTEGVTSMAFRGSDSNTTLNDIGTKIIASSIYRKTENLARLTHAETDNIGDSATEIRFSHKDKENGTIVGLKDKGTEGITSLNVNRLQSSYSITGGGSVAITRPEETGLSQTTGTLSNVNHKNTGTVSFVSQKDTGTMGFVSKKHTGTADIVYPKDARTVAIINQKDTGPVGIFNQRHTGPVGIVNQKDTGTVGVVNQRETGSVGIVNTRNTGTIGIVNQKETGTVGIVNQKRTRTVGIVNQKHNGTVGIVNQRETGTVGIVNQKHTGTVGFVNQRETGTVDIVNQKHTGTVGTVNKKHTGTEGIVNQIDTGTVGIVNQKHTGTVGIVNQIDTGTVGIVNQKHTGTVGIVNQIDTGTVDIVNQKHTGTVGIVNQRSTGTVGVVNQKHTGTVGIDNQKHTGTVGIVNQKHTGTVGIVNQKHTGTVGIVNQKHTGTVGIDNQKHTGTVGIVNQKHTGTVGIVNQKHTGTVGIDNQKHTGTVGIVNQKHTGTVGIGNEKSTGTTRISSVKDMGTLTINKLQSIDMGNAGIVTAKNTETAGIGIQKDVETVGIGSEDNTETVSKGDLKARGTVGSMGTMADKGIVVIGSQTGRGTVSVGSRKDAESLSVGGRENIETVGTIELQNGNGSLKDRNTGSIASMDERRNGRIVSLGDSRNGSNSVMTDRRLEMHTGLNESEYRLPTFKNPSDVLVVAYLRGGSTFLGEMLGFKKGNFYVYEPLHKLVKFGYFDTGGFNCTMLNESCSKCADTDGEILKVLRGIYTCDNQKYQNLLRSWQYQKAMGPTHKERSVTKKTFDECAEQYLTQCVTARSKVSKVPRISISLASELLSEFPNLKIVHLLRDPRGIINSRLSLPWNIPLSGGAVSLCNKMTRDFQEAIKIKQAYPGRLYTVYYEDLAQNPRKGFSLLYKFLGYQVGITDIRRLKELTASFKDAGRSQTRRHDSSKTASKWRDQMNSTVLTEINKACSPLYTLLGYPQLKSIDDLKNTSIPLKYDISSVYHYT